MVEGRGHDAPLSTPLGPLGQQHAMRLTIEGLGLRGPGSSVLVIGAGGAGTLLMEQVGRGADDPQLGLRAAPGSTFTPGPIVEDTATLCT